MASGFGPSGPVGAAGASGVGAPIPASGLTPACGQATRPEPATTATTNHTAHRPPSIGRRLAEGPGVCLPGTAGPTTEPMATRERLLLLDDGRPVEIDATVTAAGVRVEPDAIHTALGWELKPQGLCRGDTCLPVRPAHGLVHDDGVDLAALAALLDRPLALDVAERVAWLGASAAERGARLRVARGARLHPPRSRGTAARARRLPREEGVSARLGLLVRLPLRPAGLAGTARGAA